MLHSWLLKLVQWQSPGYSSCCRICCLQVCWVSTLRQKRSRWDFKTFLGFYQCFSSRLWSGLFSLPFAARTLLLCLSQRQSGLALSILLLRCRHTTPQRLSLFLELLLRPLPLRFHFGLSCYHLTEFITHTFHLFCFVTFELFLSFWRISIVALRSKWTHVLAISGFYPNTLRFAFSFKEYAQTWSFLCHFEFVLCLLLQCLRVSFIRETYHLYLDALLGGVLHAFQPFLTWHLSVFS